MTPHEKLDLWMAAIGVAGAARLLYSAWRRRRRGRELQEQNLARIEEALLDGRLDGALVSPELAAVLAARSGLGLVRNGEGPVVVIPPGQKGVAGG